MQSFFTRDFLLRISRINFTKIVVSLYTSWLYLLRARSTSSYHTIVHQPHIMTQLQNFKVVCFFCSWDDFFFLIVFSNLFSSSFNFSLASFSQSFTHSWYIAIDILTDYQLFNYYAYRSTSLDIRMSCFLEYHHDIWNEIFSHDYEESTYWRNESNKNVNK